MKRNSVFVIIYMAVVAIGVVAIPSIALAAQCGGAETSIIDCGNKEGESAIAHVLTTVIQIMTAGIGVLAIGAVAFGAVLYSSAAGEPAKIQKAYEVWRNTAIGVVLYIFLVAITNFLIPGGVF